MSDERFHGVSEDGRESRALSVDDLVAEYLDLLNSGGSVDRFVILAEHPDIGPDILDKLETFVELGFEKGDDNTPLGTLGDYTLRRQIGRGGMGVVYEAWQASLDRQVALKVLPAGIAVDNRAFVRFMREAKTAAQLNHPNVVGVHSVGLEKDTPYYAMEYVEGEALAQVLGRLKEAAPETETSFGKKDCVEYFAKLADAFADVADGLQHAHSKGVIHRDIKPSNLILDQEGRLRILDFGLARLEGQESLTLSGDFVGTPAYMSPEQARRRKIPVDHRTDIYSLGATLYELLTHQQPFRGKDHHDTLSQIIERDPRPPRQLNGRVPQDLETIVLKCLRKDASDRYGTAEALGQDLRRFVRGDPIEARPEDRGERFSRWVRQRRKPVIVAIALLFLSTLSGWLTYVTLRAESARVVASYELKLAVYPARVKEVVGRLAAVEVRVEALLANNASITRRTALPVVHVPRGLSQALWIGVQRTLERAAGILEELIDGLPEERDAHYHLARAYGLLATTSEGRNHHERADHFRTQAVVALENTLRIEPTFVPALVLRDEFRNGTASLFSPQAPAEPTSTAVAARAPTSWEELWREARRAQRERGWSRAVGLWKSLAELSWRDGEPYPGFLIETFIRSGTAHLKLDDHEEARVAYAHANALSSASLETTFLLGWAYLKAGRTERAGELFDGLRPPDDTSEDEVAAWISLLWRHAATRSSRSSPNLDPALRWAQRVKDVVLRAHLEDCILSRRYSWHETAERRRLVVAAEPENLEAQHHLAAALLRSTAQYPPRERRAAGRTHGSLRTGAPAGAHRSQ